MFGLQILISKFGHYFWLHSLISYYYCLKYISCIKLLFLFNLLLDIFLCLEKLFEKCTLLNDANIDFLNS